MSIEHQYFIRSATEGTNVTKLISANTPDKLAEGKTIFSFSMNLRITLSCYNIFGFNMNIFVNRQRSYIFG